MLFWEAHGSCMHYRAEGEGEGRRGERKGGEGRRGEKRREEERVGKG